MTVADRLRQIVATLPPGAAVMLPVDVVREWLESESVGGSSMASSPPRLATNTEPADWRGKLWTCPAETRLGVVEVAEALDRSPDWVYRAVNAKRAAQCGRDPLPCAKLDGVLVFVASAVRQWVQSSSVIVNPEQGSRIHVSRPARTA